MLLLIKIKKGVEGLKLTNGIVLFKSK